MNTPPRPPAKLGPPRLTAKERILAQWRGVDLSGTEKSRQIRTRDAAAVLPKVLGRLGLDRKRSEAEIGKAWNSLIDPTVAAHAQPTGIGKGTLFIAVDSNVWLAEIVRYRRKEILDRLQSCFGREMIKKLSFRVE